MCTKNNKKKKTAVYCLLTKASLCAPGVMFNYKLVITLTLTHTHACYTSSFPHFNDAMYWQTIYTSVNSKLSSHVSQGVIPSRLGSPRSYSIFSMGRTKGFTHRGLLM